VSLGTVVGLKINPNKGGSLPKWVTLLNIATFKVPFSEQVPIKLADL
jgi:hypothetical protein